MPTLEKIFGKNLKTTSYDLFIESFPSRDFYRKLRELEKESGLSLWGKIGDELYSRGLIGERPVEGEKMGKKVREGLSEILMKIGTVEVKKKPEGAFALRLKMGLRELLAEGRKLGFDLMSAENGLVMWNRQWGFLLIAGRAWAYLYKTGTCIRWTDNFPIIGYWSVSSKQHCLKLTEAIEGHMTKRVIGLHNRKRIFEIRRDKRRKRAKYKSKIM